MSREAFESPELIVTRYAGPWHEDADRARWQFTPLGEKGVAVLRRDELLRLIAALREDVQR